MPFRTFYAEVKPGEAQPVFTAGADDVHVFITTRPLPGQGQSSNGYNFTVGGPELADSPGSGLFCMNSSWDDDVEEGDEIWVGAPGEEVAWSALGIPVTILVRSHRSKVAAKKSAPARTETGA